MSISIYHCHHCNSELKFDSSINKYKCPNCEKIYSYEIDYKNRKIIFQEWKSIDIEKPKWNRIGPIITYEN